MENNYFEELSQNEIIAKQIENLQIKQREMVEQTTLELENLKSQLQNNQEVAQLKQYVASLELENQKLNSSLELNESQYLTQIKQIQDSLSIILDQGFQKTLSSSSKPVTFEPSIHLEDKKNAPSTLESPKPYKTKKEKTKNSHRYFIPSKSLGISLTTVSVLSIIGMQVIVPTISKNKENAIKNQVAGVSTDKTIINNSTASNSQKESNLNSDYKQSKATVSLAQTTWENLSDKEFGISISYPSNATNLVKTTGGNNIWFLRNEGYIMKISKFDSLEKTIEAWWSDQQNNYNKDYKIEKTTFKGNVAYHATPINPDNFSGESYFLKKNNNIIQVWIKSQPEGQDDAQRLNQMVESLRIN